MNVTGGGGGNKASAVRPGKLVVDAAAATLQKHWRKYFGNKSTSPRIERRKRKMSDAMEAFGAERGLCKHRLRVCLVIVALILGLTFSMSETVRGHLRGQSPFLSSTGEHGLERIAAMIHHWLDEASAVVRKSESVKSNEDVRGWLDESKCVSRWVHSSFTRNADEMLIRWSTLVASHTCGNGVPIVHYSVHSGHLSDNKVSGRVVPIRHGGSYEALLTDLIPHARYYFAVGFEPPHPDHKVVMTTEGSFVTCARDGGRRVLSDAWPVLRLGFLADQGAQGFPRKAVMTHGTAHAMKVIRALGKDMASKEYDAIVHLGDLSYNEVYAAKESIAPLTMETATGAKAVRNWGFLIQDLYMRQMKPIFLSAPFHAVPGNHDKDFSYFKKQRPCWSSYRAIFGNDQIHSSMPECMDQNSTTVENSLSYETDYGLLWNYGIHLPFANTEVEKTRLEIKLEAVAAKKTLDGSPAWLSITGHNCFLSSKSSCFGSKRNMAVFHDLLVKNDVDLVFFGHAHTYERSYQGSDAAQVEFPTSDERGKLVIYRDPKEPIYINAGLGGAGEAPNCGHDYHLFDEPQPAWSKRRFSVGCYDGSKWQHDGFGFGRLTVYDRYLLEWEVVMTNGTVVDRIQIVKRKPS